MPPHGSGSSSVSRFSQVANGGGGETLIFTILHFPVARWVEGYAGIQDKYGQLYTICVCAAFIILLIMGRLRHKEVKRVVYACLQAGTDLMLHWLFRAHAEDLACLPRGLMSESLDLRCV